MQIAIHFAAHRQSVLGDVFVVASQQEMDLESGGPGQQGPLRTADSSGADDADGWLSLVCRHGRKRSHPREAGQFSRTTCVLAEAGATVMDWSLR
jgi:hypothetical protein